LALILSIETATSVCSVALSENGKRIALKESEEEKSHALKLTSFIENIFKETSIPSRQIDAVALSKGPGSYTGLRIGVAAAKGLCYALDKPLLGINTLEAMTQLFTSENPELVQEKILLCPMIDARRMEVYTALFNSSLVMIHETMSKIIDDDAFANELSIGKIVFFGDGAQKCKGIISHPNAVFKSDLRMSAKGLISLAEKAFRERHFESPVRFEPFYLKDFIPGVRKSQKIY
jgi:tRNA threonylcarbamoyladenosine biosynthesis protein TsaB